MPAQGDGPTIGILLAGHRDDVRAALPTRAQLADVVAAVVRDDDGPGGLPLT